MLSTTPARGRGGFAMRITRRPFILPATEAARTGAQMARETTSSGARRRRWPWVLLGFGVLVFVLVGLGLLARPMMDVKPEADAARDELGMAQDALKDEDLDAAKVHVAAARAHVDEASTLVNGFGGDVWRWVPVGGGAIQDVRHLVGALDQATAIAEIGTEVYPELMQSDSLVQDAQVDLDQLDGILTSLNQAGAAPARRGRRPRGRRRRHALHRRQGARGPGPGVGQDRADQHDVRRGGAGPRRAARRAGRRG